VPLIHSAEGGKYTYAIALMPQIFYAFTHDENWFLSTIFSITGVSFHRKHAHLPMMKMEREENEYMSTWNPN
jgi:hypothetical protein